MLGDPGLIEDRADQTFEVLRRQFEANLAAGIITEDELRARALAVANAIVPSEAITLLQQRANVLRREGADLEQRVSLVDPTQQQRAKEALDQFTLSLAEQISVAGESAERQQQLAASFQAQSLAVKAGITDLEVDQVISGFLTPDIDLDQDGVNDAMSLGLGIRGVGGIFTSPN